MWADDPTKSVKLLAVLFNGPIFFDFSYSEIECMRDSVKPLCNFSLGLSPPLKGPYSTRPTASSFHTLHLMTVNHENATATESDILSTPIIGKNIEFTDEIQPVFHLVYWCRHVGFP